MRAIEDTEVYPISIVSGRAEALHPPPGAHLTQVHHHVTPAVESLHRTDRGEEFFHTSLSRVRLIEHGFLRAAEGGRDHAMPFQKKRHDLVFHRIEIAINIVDTRRVLGKPQLEAPGDRRRGMPDEPEDLRRVEAEVSVDEGRVV